MRADQVAQSFIQPRFENLQRWKQHSFSGCPVSLLDWPHGKKGFFHVFFHIFWTSILSAYACCLSPFTMLKSLGLSFWQPPHRYRQAAIRWRQSHLFSRLKKHTCPSFSSPDKCFRPLTISVTLRSMQSSLWMSVWFWGGSIYFCQSSDILCYLLALFVWERQPCLARWKCTTNALKEEWGQAPTITTSSKCRLKFSNSSRHSPASTPLYKGFLVRSPSHGVSYCALM